MGGRQRTTLFMNIERSLGKEKKPEQQKREKKK